MLQTTRTNLMKKLFVLLIALFVLNSLEGYGQINGSTCDNPLVVNSLPFNDAGNTSTYGSNYSNSDVPTTASGAITTGTGSNYYLSGDEVVYAYTPICNQVVTITTTNDDDWIGLWAFTGCSFSSTVGYHTSSFGATRSIVDLPLTGGETYYFVISTWSAPQSTNYTINITLVSDDCSSGGGGNPPGPNYCIPVYSTGCSLGDRISNVTLAGETVTLNNSTGCSPNAYGNYTNLNAPDLEQGGTYFATIATDYSSPSYEEVRVWIDYNDDNIFSPNEEIAAINGLQSGGSTFSFTVPQDAPLGLHRMRVKLEYATNANQIDPCITNSSWGETEDYMIEVIAAGGGGNPPGPNSCNWTVTITTQNTFADEVSWTLKSSNGTTVLSGGGTDFGVYTDNVNNVSGPLEFYISAEGYFNDNEPAYTVSNGSTTVVSGQLYGGDNATYSNLNCAGGGNTGDDIIPTVCTNQTFTLQAGSSLHFYDDGGPGGSCNTDVAPGNFANAGCETITTICAAPGEYLIADFFLFSMFNTTSGLEWMVIYDGPNTSSPILFDNRVGAPDNPIGTDCTYNGGLTPCATGRCLTFRFNGTSVVSREGWDALITSTPVQCSPLPVELSHFSANCDKHVILSWATESELNSEKFIVEKSRSGAHWEVVDEVDAAGNSNSHLAYSLTDYNPNNGISYYRLRQVDFDGKEEVFGPISANCEGIDNSMIAYPNPNNGNFTVEINSSVEINDAVIQLADMTGKIVSSQVVQVANGVSQISIEKSEYLNRGTYVLKVLNAEKYFSPIKVVVR